MNVERLPVELFPDAKSAAVAVARRIATWSASGPRSPETAVLGLATGPRRSVSTAN